MDFYRQLLDSESWQVSYKENQQSLDLMSGNSIRLNVGYLEHNFQ